MRYCTLLFELSHRELNAGNIRRRCISVRGDQISRPYDLFNLITEKYLYAVYEFRGTDQLHSLQIKRNIENGHASLCTSKKGVMRYEGVK